MTTRWTPHATVATIVENNGRFLMIEEYAYGTTPVFNQPAGHIEEHETIVEASKRETLEESGWHVEPQGLVGFYIFKAPNNVTYRSEEHTSELQSRPHLVCRLLLEKKKKQKKQR